VNKKRIIISIIVAILTLGIAGIIIFGVTQQQSAQTPEHLISLGERFLLEQNFEQALVQFLRVIEIDPMNPRGYTGAAEAHIGLGQVDAAVAVLQRGLEQTGSADIAWMWVNVDPEDARAYLIVADILVGFENMITVAIEILREGLLRTGSEEIRNRLYELEGVAAETEEQGDTESVEFANEQTQEDTVRQAIEAPFTAAQRALMDQVCDAMLAGEYDAALLLLTNPELIEIMQLYGTELSGGDDGPSFMLDYRNMFRFHWDPWEWDGFNVYMVNVQDGDGIVAQVHVGNHLSAQRTSWSYTEVANGLAHGISMVHSMNYPGGPVLSSGISEISNGLMHGEHRHWSVYAGTMITTFDNGFYVQLGPPNHLGRIPVTRFIDSEFDDDENAGHVEPVGRGFTEPMTRDIFIIDFENVSPTIPSFY